jgi:hypothetical protein
MEINEALRKIEILGRELMNDDDDFVQILGASITSLPMAADLSREELLSMVNVIFSAARERLEREEEAESAIAELLNPDED